MRGMVSSVLYYARYELVADHEGADKPDEMLASDSKVVSGHNPTVGKDSAANK